MSYFSRSIKRKTEENNIEMKTTAVCICVSTENIQSKMLYKMTESHFCITIMGAAAIVVAEIDLSISQHWISGTLDASCNDFAFVFSL